MQEFKLKNDIYNVKRETNRIKRMELLKMKGYQVKKKNKNILMKK